MTPSLSQVDIKALPAAYDPNRAENVYAEWCEKLPGGKPDSKKTPHAQAIVMAVAGNSPYLAQSILKSPLFFEEMLYQNLDELRLKIQEAASSLAVTPPGMPDLMRELRILKGRMALLTAVADITGAWNLQNVTEALSDFAAAATQAVVARLLQNAFDAGDLAWPEEPEDLASAVARSGYTVLGMGKLGARELNYSSDIDLIVLFDEEVARYEGRKSIQECFSRMTRELVRALNDRTADGYVFRVDLRLRPDAGSTPLAMSMEAAEFYYQSAGLNWERAAMIKARPIAGDVAAGREFLERIKAFVWRKNLDYAAVQDIQDIKHKIHSHHQHQAIDIAGQDVKLGYGGIREIEFFAQIYQLIMGGRAFELRVPQTLGALAALARTGRIPEEDEATLASAYRYLRRLEHRLQMIDDEQTHRLPESEEELRHVALFMGYADVESFREDLVSRLEAVHTIYDDLAAETTGTGRPAAVSDDIWKTFKDGQKAHAIVDGWLAGSLRASRTERARVLLKGLMPGILEALTNAADPDAAIVRLDEFLSKLPAGVQLFSLIQAHPWLLELLVDIMGSAPALANELGRNMLLLDAVLSSDFFKPLPDENALAEELDDLLQRAADYQDVLDFTRRWANDLKFQLGVQMLRHLINANEAGRQLTIVAEVCMRALYPRTLAEFEQMHGAIDGEMAVMALGKLGAQELTFQSDLDLIFLYDSRAEISKGPRPLPVSQYFARLSQRYINAISALTAEGRLFEVDMRLRPSGHAGPIAIALDTFVEYQRTKAWTWEHMALTKARCIIGSPGLKAQVDSAVEDILEAPRDPDRLLAHVADMRRRLDKEFGTLNIWNIKYVRGGLLDIEFIIQYLILKTAPERKRVLSPHLGLALDSLEKADAIEPDAAARLKAALALMQDVQSYLRLTCEEAFSEDAAAKALKTGLAAFCGAADFEALKVQVTQMQEEVRQIYDALIEGPSLALASEDNGKP